MPLLSSGDRAVLDRRRSARCGGLAIRSAAEPLLRLVTAAATDPHVRLEAVTRDRRPARAGGQPTTLLDLLSDPSPPIRGGGAALGRDAAIRKIS